MPEEIQAEIRGRDMVSGLPKTVILTSEEIRGALEEPVSQIIDAVKQTLDRTPPELASDIMDRGIMLAGGGSLLQGIEERLRDETQMPAHLAESPLTCVAVGSGRSLEEFEAIHTLNAKSRSDRLTKQVATLTRQLDYYEQKASLSSQLANQQRLDTRIGMSSYQPVAANVIGRDPVLWYQTIEVDKGSDDGVALNDPVTGDGALVGKVTTVDSTFSIVTLITDHSYAVAATVLDSSSGGDSGVLVPAIGNPNSLLVQELPAHAPIQAGQQVVTAGFTDPSNKALDSLYPAGIPIGQVTNFDQNQLLNNQQVQVAPAANLRHLSVVQVLTRPHPGTARAQLGAATG